MNVMTSHSVVDRMAADLAERRRNTICRNRAPTPSVSARTGAQVDRNALLAPRIAHEAPRLSTTKQGPLIL